MGNVSEGEEESTPMKASSTTRDVVGEMELEKQRLLVNPDNGQLSSRMATEMMKPRPIVVDVISSKQETEGQSESSSKAPGQFENEMMKQRLVGFRGHVSMEDKEDHPGQVHQTSKHKPPTSAKAHQRARSEW